MSVRAGLVLAAAFAAAGAPQAIETAGGVDTHLAASVRVVKDRISAIVGVDHPAELAALRVDEAGRAAEISARAAAMLPSDRAAARGRAWRDLGFGNGSEPAALVAAIARDLPGMTVDTAQRRLLVDPNRLPSDVARGDPDVDSDASVMLATGLAPDEPVAGHYVAHVLLDGQAPEGAQTTDSLLARAALSEGAANLTALVFLFGGVGLETEVVSGAVSPEDALGGRLIPDTLRGGSPAVSNLLQFVYLDGFAQASALAKKGGFRRLSQERAARRLTRDVIHLDRAPAPAAPIPAPAIPAGVDLVAIDQDSLGEEGVVSLISLVTGKDNLGMIAGDGWAGDGLWRFEPKAFPSGEPADGLTVWISSWSSEDDARDFAYSLERCLQARFPGEQLSGSGQAGAQVLRRLDRVYTLERSGTEVRFRVATPSVEAKLNPEPKKKTSPPQSQRPKK